MKRKSQEVFIKEVENKFPGMYDLSKVQYVNSRTKVTLICKKCGFEWETTPVNVLQGNHECPKCNRKMKNYFKNLRTLKGEQFLEKSSAIHRSRYSYDKVNYQNNYTKVTITCPIHGDFEQTPNHHLAGKGCPKCNRIWNKSSKRSKGELKVSQFLQELGIPHQEQVEIRVEGYQKAIVVDFVVEIDKQLYYIEVNGKQHYTPVAFFGGKLQFQQQVLRDNVLKKYCKDNNIHFIELKYDLKDQEVKEMLIKQLRVK